MSKLELNTEEKILNAAESVFIEAGYDGARMKTIAEKAGINKALLHYYFRSKENLFEKIIHNLLKLFVPKLDQVFSSDMSPLEKIEAFVSLYLDMLTKNPKLPLFVLSNINKHPGLVKFLPKKIFDIIKVHLTTEMEKGNLRKIDPEHLLITIISMCIFPYIGRPITQHMTNKTDEEYTAFLKDRKPEIMRLVQHLLIP